MMNPWLGMAVMLLALAAGMGGLCLWQKRAAPHPELVRKLLHVGMGLMVLTFPWVFNAAWPVLLLLTVAVLGLAAVRLLTGLRQQLGGVLGGVARKSLGEFYFALSVAVLFVLSRGQPHENILYCVPLLVLALADAVAALIGVKYGHTHYATVDGHKSAEGSISFFLAAFFSVHVPLLLLTDVGRAQTLLIALILGLLIMIFEAVAWRGLDNLFIPLVSFLALKIYLGPPALEEMALLARVLVLVALFGLVLLGRRWATLDGSGLLTAALVGYLAWALGDWRWLVFPLVLFLTYTLLSPRTPANSQRIHNVHAVLSVSAAGLIWLFLARAFDSPRLLFPYALAFAAHLAIIGLARLKHDNPRRSTLGLLIVCVARGWAILFLPFWLLEQGAPILRQPGEAATSPILLPCLLTALAGVTAAAVLFALTQPRLDDCPMDTPRWLRQAGAAGLGSLLGLAPLYLF